MHEMQPDSAGNCVCGVYNGDKCQEGHKCENGGQPSLNGMSCNCPNKWGGDFCTNNLCNLGNPNTNGLSCICPTAYEGSLCQTSKCNSKSKSIPDPSTGYNSCVRYDRLTSKKCPEAWTGNLCHIQNCGDHGSPDENDENKCKCDGNKWGPGGDWMDWI